MEDSNTFPEPVALEDPAPGLPPKPHKLDELEMKTIEVHFLKIQNIKLQADRLQEDLKKAHQFILDEQQKLKAFHQHLGEKYGVDLTKHTIEPDGTIKPGARSIHGFPGVPGPSISPGT